jgi:hypothetical protein
LRVIIIIAARDREAMCLLLLDKGVALGGVDKNGMTALHEAAFRGHQEIFDKLCTYATAEDLSLKDVMGNTAEDYFMKCKDEVSPTAVAAESKDGGDFDQDNSFHKGGYVGEEEGEGEGEDLEGEASLMYAESKEGALDEGSLLTTDSKSRK